MPVQARRLLVLLAAVTALMLTGVSSALAAVGVKNGVRAQNPAGQASTGLTSSESPCADPGLIAGSAGIVSGFCVAAEETGDLTATERQQIQNVVDQAGRPIDVVGSAARGARGAESDIDYTAPNSSHPYLQPFADDLPGLDPEHGILHGGPDPFEGPSIRFEPGP